MCDHGGARCSFDQDEYGKIVLFTLEKRLPNSFSRDSVFASVGPVASLAN